MTMTCLKTNLSLSRTLMSISIMSSSVRMHMNQEVCTINAIQMLTSILPML